VNNKINNKGLLIVPVYNEVERLNTKTWAKISNSKSFDILFVDDGSTDKSYSMLRRLQVNNPRISIKRLVINRGKGNAIYEGIKLSKKLGYNYVGLMDADLSVLPSNLTFGLVKILENSSLFMVSGARIQLAGWNVERTYFRRWAGRLIATLISLVTGITIYDPQSPCKWFNLSNISLKYLKKPRTRWFYEVELLLNFITSTKPKNNFEILEFPILGWEEKKGSHLNFFSFPKILFELTIISYLSIINRTTSKNLKNN
jgi:glycosyltransferase involved in cell wall biosynthesis